MFSVYCPRHGSDVLLNESRISGLDNSGDAITLRWTCWCGHAGASHTGRARRHTAPVL